MAFKVPEKYRVTAGRMATKSTDGNNGCFVIKMGGKFFAYVIASSGQKWEHVSVHIAARKNLQKTPTWNQMCIIKDLFWSPEDRVVQYHPPRSEWVNNHLHVLHLWRPIDVELPFPPSHLVGHKELRPEDAEKLFG